MTKAANAVKPKVSIADFNKEQTINQPQITSTGKVLSPEKTTALKFEVKKQLAATQFLKLPCHKRIY